MTELETIARELHTKSQAPDADGMWRWITSWCPSGDWDDIGPGPREAFVLMARTTLESMREPSEAMIDAARADKISWGASAITSADYDEGYREASPERCWQAMIDVILKGEKDQ